jgi:Zn-dependent protease
VTDEQAEPRRGSELLLGHVGGVPIFVAPTWFLVAALVTVVFQPVVVRWVPDLGAWSWVVAGCFAVLLYASVLVHELGHAMAARSYGLKVHRITLQMLGGVTETDRQDISPGRQFVIAGVGPLLSLVLGAFGLGLAQVLSAGTVLHLLAVQLGAANLLVGIFNLLPGLPLDGGQLTRAAIWKVTGSPSTGTTVAVWIGRGLAVLLVVGPIAFAAARGHEPDLVFVIWTALIGLFVWQGANQSLRAERVQDRLRQLSVRGLTRRAIPVLADTPLAEALRRLGEAGAQALVVVDRDDQPLALVNETAVTATPVERRPWVTVGALSRRLESGLVLQVGMDGADLLTAMRAVPAAEYLVVDDAGRVVGVLTTTDVDRAFAGT